eukprot:306401-Rhodomonas_salina.1
MRSTRTRWPSGTTRSSPSPTTTSGCAAVNGRRLPFLEAVLLPFMEGAMRCVLNAVAVLYL